MINVRKIIKKCSDNSVAPHLILFWASELPLSFSLLTLVRDYYSTFILELIINYVYTGKTACGPILPGEFNDPGMVSALRWFRLPRILQWAYTFWVRYVRRDALYASLLADFREKTIKEYYALIAQREAYRAQWFAAWQEAGLDFLLTAPNALPAVPNGGMKKGWKVCGYSFLFNLVRPSFLLH